ncbi:MAG: DUF3365 domain-containing protein [Candidatus Electrothrix sp. GM3_4]|nr:DUF3365 domain-containing protein [Candidatus Electrothrix sp. GM3_4]
MLGLSLTALCAPISLSAASSDGEISTQRIADMLYTVIRAHRTTYATLIVNRLSNEEEVIEASEHWQDEQALLLPAQMFRATAELVQKENDLDFSYSLLSLWPINSKNNAKTDVEKKGLQYVVDNQGKNFYGEETLGDDKYFTAVYPDVAVSKACISCHNDHKDSPKKDFKLNDVMGGIVIRIPVDAD